MDESADGQFPTVEAELLLQERGFEVGKTAEEVVTELRRRGFRESQEEGHRGRGFFITRVHPPHEYKGWPIFGTETGSTISITPDAFAGGAVLPFDEDGANRDALVRAFAGAVLKVEQEAAAWEAQSEA